MSYYTRRRQAYASFYPQPFMIRKDAPGETAHTKTLYVCRPVFNAGKIIDWAKAAGFETTYPPEDMHVTIAYSKQPVAWGNLDTKQDVFEVSPDYFGRQLQVLGEDTAVLRFWSWQLSERWSYFILNGASWDYEEYHPHISISRSIPANLAQMPPYRGPIVLGPERFSEVETEWADDIVEKQDGRS